ncbi:MAG: type III secretion system chaperone [Victivallales bacterium]|nr:type III secretion system chaperone [Victivallales bacterium]
MDYNELIEGFAAKFGVGGLTVKDGITALNFDGMTVEIVHNEVDHSVLFYGVVGQGPTDDIPKYNAFLLQANFLFQGTGGATLAQNPKTKDYVLVRAFPLEYMDTDAFIAVLEAFVNGLERWRKLLADFNPVKKEADAMMQEPLPFSGGFIRV